MNSLARVSLAGLEAWFSAHAIASSIGLIACLLTLYAIIVNLHDLIRTIHIHFM